jgi:hypothetical protein
MNKPQVTWKTRHSISAIVRTVPPSDGRRKGAAEISSEQEPTVMLRQFFLTSRVVSACADQGGLQGSVELAARRGPYKKSEKKNGMKRAVEEAAEDEHILILRRVQKGRYTGRCNSQVLRNPYLSVFRSQAARHPL